MKILSVTPLALPEVHVIRFARFGDKRGFFTEHLRMADFKSIDVLAEYDWVQANESVSVAGVVRGLHFQWNEFQGKVVRTLAGRMVDLVMDIRKGSPNYGQIIAYDMPADDTRGWDEYIWVPPGFAHGSFFPEGGRIEYFVTSVWSPGNEGSISPLADDLDWSLCDESLRAEYESLKAAGPLMSEKDASAPNLAGWSVDGRSDVFQYGEL